MNVSKIGISPFNQLVSLLHSGEKKTARQFCKAHDFTFEKLTRMQQLTVLRSSPHALYSLSSLDLFINYKELTPNLLDALSVQEGLGRMVIHDYDCSQLSENFAQLQNLKSLHISSSYDPSSWEFLQLLEVEFNWNPIVELKNLNFLRLINVGVSEIDPRIKNLTQLEHLSLNYNHIKELPEAVFEIPSLWVLELSGNGLNPIEKKALQEQVSRANQKREGRKLILSIDIRTT